MIMSMNKKEMIFNLRFWDTKPVEEKGLYIAEDLGSKSTISVNPREYERLEGILFENQRIYVRK